METRAAPVAGTRIVYRYPVLRRSSIHDPGRGVDRDHARSRAVVQNVELSDGCRSIRCGDRID